MPIPITKNRSNLIPVLPNFAFRLARSANFSSQIDLRTAGTMIRVQIPVLICLMVILGAVADGLGVNWGTLMTHPLLPSSVVQMLKDNGIKKVKLFDADSWTLGAFAGSKIEVMVGIPNDQLSRISKSYDEAKDWVKENVTKYTHNGGVNIKYVAVGNEPFLRAYNGSFIKTTFPALENIQKALDEAGVGGKIKATVPLNADVYNSPVSKPVPSAGNFRSDIRSLMHKIVKFLHANGAPFTVNIYPYLSLYENPDFPVDFAFFDSGSNPINDGGKRYTNMFDANFDTLVWSLKRAGVPDLKIIVGEAGWPTDGEKHATNAYAKRFYDGLLRKLGRSEGTPLRPGHIEVYLFGLFDENMKSVAPGNFERYWGIFTYDGKPKFPMDLTGRGKDRLLAPVKGVKYLPKQWCVVNKDAKDMRALPKNVDYACSHSDCTALADGASCEGLDTYQKASYAFNMYFQMADQDVTACNFQGLAVLSAKNASVRNCLFPLQIESAGERIGVRVGLVGLLMLVVLGFL